jgi:hypothetical protein
MKTVVSAECEKKLKGLSKGDLLKVVATITLLSTASFDYLKEKGVLRLITEIEGDLFFFARVADSSFRLICSPSKDTNEEMLMIIDMVTPSDFRSEPAR